MRGRSDAVLPARRQEIHLRVQINIRNHPLCDTATPEECLQLLFGNVNISRSELRRDRSTASVCLCFFAAQGRNPMWARFRAPSPTHPARSTGLRRLRAEAFDLTIRGVSNCPVPPQPL